MLSQCCLSVDQRKESPVHTGLEFAWAPESVWMLRRRETFLPHAEKRIPSAQIVVCCYTD
jgi:hypothetical protein